MLRTSVTLLTLALVGTAPALAATQTWNYQVRGHGAWAWSHHGDGCVSTGLDVGANEQVSHSAGSQPTTSRGAWVGYWSYNWCTGTQTYGWGFVPDVNFSGNLSSASVAASITVYSYGWQTSTTTTTTTTTSGKNKTTESRDAGTRDAGSGGYVFLGASQLDVQVAWTGVGDTVMGTNMSISRWGRDMSRSRWSGQWRNASVSITATLDGAAVPLTDAHGDLGKFNSGWTSVYRY